MKRILAFILPAFISVHAFSQSLYFPPLNGNAWETISPESLNWCTDKIAPLNTYLQSNNTKAFILLKDGKIVIEQYFGTFTGDSAWYWASAGKTLTAFMTGIAKQEQLLSLSDTTSKYLGNGWTSCTPEQESRITVRHQLTMTTGLDDGVADPFCTSSSCLKFKSDAGTRWAYHNAPYTLLDSVIEAATGQTMNAYTNQKLKTQTGITGAFFPSGFNHVFYSRPRSMARFGLLMLNRGSWNGTPVLTDTSYFNAMITTSQQLNLSYGYLWWLNGKASYMVPTLQTVIPGSLNPDAPADMYAALGKNGQIINIVPSLNLVYIRMGDAPDAGEVPILFNNEVWKLLNDIMCNRTAVQDTRKAAGINIYPNPSCNELNVEIPGEVFSCTLTVIASGKQVYSGSFLKDRLMIRTTDLHPGLYSLEIVRSNGAVRRKILVQP